MEEPAQPLPAEKWPKLHYAIALAAVAGVLGFIALAGSPTAWYVLFLLLPAAVGFCLAFWAPPGKSGLGKATTGVVALTLVVLVVNGFEGLVCAAMAAPLVFLDMLAGMVVAWIVRALWPRARGGPAVLLVLTLLPTGQAVERSRSLAPRVEPITSAVELAAPPERVWQAIRAVDAIHGKLPWLLRLGLPVPQRCTLEGEGVGAVRTCYFDTGKIVERVAEWDPPRRMRLEIAQVTLGGRHWLKFAGADYSLSKTARGTRLERTTTIVSELRPALYWRPLERLGVEAEHDYLLDDLSSQLGRVDQTR